MITDIEALYAQAEEQGAAYAISAGLPIGDPEAYAGWYCYYHQDDQPPHEQSVPEYRATMIDHWRRELMHAEGRDDDAAAAEHRERLRALGDDQA